MTNHTEPITTFAHALVNIGGKLSSTLRSMEAFQASGRSHPDVDPIPVVLARLLESAFEGMGERFTDDDLRGAAVMLDDASERIATDLFHVA